MFGCEFLIFFMFSQKINIFHATYYLVTLLVSEFVTFGQNQLIS